jgi:hypothetical protein
MNKSNENKVIKSSIYQSNQTHIQSFLTNRYFGIISSDRNGSIEDEIRRTGLGYLLVKSLDNNKDFEGYLVIAGENESETHLKSFLRRYNGRLVNTLEDCAISSSSAFYRAKGFYSREESLF